MTKKRIGGIAVIVFVITMLLNVNFSAKNKDLSDIFFSQCGSVGKK